MTPVPTIVDRLLTNAAHQPRGDAFVFLGDGERETARCTWLELAGAALRLADGWHGRLARGERLLMMFAPGLEFIAAFFGCLAAGLVPVPVSAPRSEADCAHAVRIARAAGACAALVDAATAALLCERLAVAWQDAVPVEVVTWPAETASAGPAPCCSTARPDDLAFLQFTSGSTGDPKGVMVSHANLMSNEAAIARAFGHDEHTIVLGWLPFHHDMGLVGIVMQPVYLGRPCILMPPAAFIQKPLRWLRALSRYRVTTSGGPNFGFRLCLEALEAVGPSALSGIDLSSWRVAFAGAEPLDADLLDTFVRRLAAAGLRQDVLLPCYGMAEATLMVSAVDRRRPLVAPGLDAAALRDGQVRADCGGAARRLVSCGPAAGAESVRIVDPGTGRPVPDGRIGEVWVRGPAVAQGYWNEPELTRHVFGACLGDGSDDRTYLRTGDLGFLHDGELVLTGRLKDLLIVNGRNFAPQDVEAAVQGLDRAMRPQAAAFADAAGQSERVVLVQEIYPHLARQLDAESLQRRIRGAVSERVGLQLAEIVLTTSRLPVTTSGKIRRAASREAWRTGRLAPLPSAQPDH